MCSRGVWQLRGLMISYCRWGGSSRGVREFLERDFVQFAEANPQIQFCAVPRGSREPYARGYYVRDKSKTLSLKNLSAQMVAERLQFLRDMRPLGLRKWAKPFRTTPSIQGHWELGQQLDRPHRTLRG